MNRQEVEEKITQGDGQWITENLVFTQDDDGTIHAKWLDSSRKGQGFIVGKTNPPTDFHFTTSGGAKDFDDMVAFGKAVASVLGFRIALKEASEYTIVQKVPDPEMPRVQGMVEAYEKILLGRDITASK